MNFTKMTEFIDTMPNRGIPNADIVIMKDNEIVYRHSSGFVDREKTKPTSPDTMYRYYSVTKLLTCTCAMRLLEEGKLKMEDPVAKYIPEYANIRVKQKDGTIAPAKTVMTLHHLITMTAGFDYDIGHEEIQKAAHEPGASTLSVVRAMANVPLNFEPGTHWAYSLCLDVLGGVIEVVSGMKLGEYMKKIIFDPLGMKDATFFPTKEQEERLSDMYVCDIGRGAADWIPKSKFYICDDFESGGGGLCGTVDDYIKFVNALANDGQGPNGYRLLKPETIALMEVNRLDDPQLMRDYLNFLCRMWGYGWGYGCRVHVDPIYSNGKSPVGEFGWDGATGMYTLVDRQNKLSIFFAMSVHGCMLSYMMLQPILRDLTYAAIAAE